VADDGLFLHAQPGLVEADVDHLAVAAAPRMKDRHQERAGAEDGRPGVGERHRHRTGARSGNPVANCIPQNAWAIPVVAPLARQRPGLAERRDAQDGEALVWSGGSSRATAPPPRGGPAVVLHDGVGGKRSASRARARA